MDLFLGSLIFSLIYVSVFVPVPYCFDYCSFECSLKSGSVITPALFFFLKIGLAVRGLLWFQTILKIICLNYVKNTIGILMRIALNL